MKKIMLAALTALTVVSCKKETPIPVSNPVEQKSTAQQVADLIQKHDPKMYESIYANTDQKKPKPSIHVHHGVFYWPSGGDPQDGTCLPNLNCVCFVCMDIPKMEAETSPVYEITGDFHQAYDTPGQGVLYINDSLNTTIENLKSIDVTFDDSGVSALNYSIYE